MVALHPRQWGCRDREDLGVLRRQYQQALLMAWMKERRESKVTAKFPTWESGRLVTPLSTQEEEGACWER